MPPRTNQFQRLLYFVQKHAAEGAEVTESKMLPDLVTGTEREVDVCIEQTVAGHPVVICVECRAWQRRQSVSWVDEMKGKHDSLPTNVLVLASSSGFTPEAGRRAEIHGIELLSLDQDDEASISRLLADLQRMWVKEVRHSVTKVLARVSEHPVEALEAETVQVFPDHAILDLAGNQVGEARDLVRRLLESEHLRNEMQIQADESHTRFTIDFEVRSGYEIRPCLEMIEPRVIRPIERIRVQGRCSITVNVIGFPFEHGLLGTTEVAWGAGELLGRDALLVASRSSPNGEFTVSLDAGAYQFSTQLANRDDDPEGGRDGS